MRGVGAGLAVEPLEDAGHRPGGVPRDKEEYATMSDGPAPSTTEVGSITVRYWAGARAAAGVESDVLPAEEGTTLADVLAAVRALHRDRPRLSEVVQVCSVLVGERPVGSADPSTVRLRAGDTVELLPPFAGG